jgi:hypothetical protein
MTFYAANFGIGSPVIIAMHLTTVMPPNRSSGRPPCSRWGCARSWCTAQQVSSRSPEPAIGGEFARTRHSHRRRGRLTSPSVRQTALHRNHRCSAVCVPVSRGCRESPAPTR